MTQNKLTDLNNHLFMSLERLNEEELSEAELGREIKRSEAITSVASQIISNAALSLKAVQVRANLGQEAVVPKTLLE